MPPKGDGHGPSAYKRGTCRCDNCRAAYLERRKVWRKNYEARHFSVRNGSSKLMLDVAPLVNYLTRTGELEQLNRVSLRRWLRDGISVYTADVMCIRFGVHPALVFGDVFYSDLEQDLPDAC